MKKRKNYLIIITILIVCVLALSGFIVYDKLLSKEKCVTEPEYVNPNEAPNNKGDIVKNNPSNLSVEEIENLVTYAVSDFNGYALYKYTQSNFKSLIDYLSNMDNSYKLLIGGIFSTKGFNDIENNLIKRYGTNISVEKNDYYVMKSDSFATYLYDSVSNSYKYNEDGIMGSDVITDIGGYMPYNYRIKDIAFTDDSITIIYYGLFMEDWDIGPASYFNKNLNYDIDVYNDMTAELDDYKIDEYFNKNKDEFVQFKYVFKNDNNNYILTDFAIN